MRALMIVGALVASASVASAEVELKNDGFQSGQGVAFHAGFVTGEIAAMRFNAPDSNRSLTKIQLLFGSTSPTDPAQTVTVRIYDDSAGTNAPGVELSMNDFQLTGSSSAMHEIILPNPIAVPAQFRVGIQVTHTGSPSVADDQDGSPSHSFIFAIPGGWVRSIANGNWIIRAFITDGTAPPIDDAGPTTGGQCSGNGDCPLGQFCDTSEGACTFDCREDTDCGGGSCNSLGQCIGGDDGGGGGCCRTDNGGEAGIVLLGIGLAAVLLRRRQMRRA